MPVLNLESTKHFCQDCGWSVVSSMRLPVAMDLTLPIAYKECPLCESKNVGMARPKLLEQLNPLNGLQDLAFRGVVEVRRRMRN